MGESEIYITQHFSKIPEDKRSFGGPECRWKDNIEIGLHYEDVDLMYLTHDKNKWPVDMNMTINFRIQ
jgi:hypothetical protein